MRNYLPPEIQLLSLEAEQAVMASSLTNDAARDNYDSFDLFE